MKRHSALTAPRPLHDAEALMKSRLILDRALSTPSNQTREVGRSKEILTNVITSSHLAHLTPSTSYAATNGSAQRSTLRKPPMFSPYQPLSSTVNSEETVESETPIKRIKLDSIRLEPRPPMDVTPSYFKIIAKI